MTILPVAYLGSIEYFAHLIQEECVIDLGEHFIKRSERNRGRIMTANGVMDLTVQVRNANRPKTPVKEVVIDYSKRWQHQHWGAIVSSYRSSAYFEHFAPELERFYSQEYSSLAEFNLELTRTLLALMGANKTLEVSHTYVEAEAHDLDLRPKQKEGSTFSVEPYFQLFCDRHPFESNLSVLDLIFSEGRASLAILERCQL